MPQDTLYVAPDAQVEALRVEIQHLLSECLSFAEEVAEAEAVTGCMSVVTIQQHIQYLRAIGDELRRPVQ